MKTTSLALFACCGLLFAPVPVLADAGHSHGGKRTVTTVMLLPSASPEIQRFRHAASRS